MGLKTAFFLSFQIGFILILYICPVKLEIENNYVFIFVIVLTQIMCFEYEITSCHFVNIFQTFQNEIVIKTFLSLNYQPTTIIITRFTDFPLIENRNYFNMQQEFLGPQQNIHILMIV